MFLGEYGGTPDTEEIDGYIGTLHERLDDALAGGTQWVYTPGWDPTVKDGWNGEDFSIIDNSGAVRANFRPRPFARRIAGTPGAVHVVNQVDHTLNTLDLTWSNDPAAGDTELFLPSAFWDGKVDVRADGDVSCKLDGELARCSAASAGDKHLLVAYGTPGSGTKKHKSCGLTGAEAFLVLAAARRWRRRRR
jgi:hypothetical protein